MKSALLLLAMVPMTGGAQSKPSDMGPWSATSGSFSLQTPTQIMVKLSDPEYSHLEQLRQAVADEEKRLASKYGAKVEGSCIGDTANTEDVICRLKKEAPYWIPPDHYEFHQQFLLIDKAKP